jgi:hypothetical protein
MKTSTALCKGGPLHTRTFAYQDLCIRVHKPCRGFLEKKENQPIETQLTEYNYQIIKERYLLVKLPSLVNFDQLVV